MTLLRPPYPATKATNTTKPVGVCPRCAGAYDSLLHRACERETVRLYDEAFDNARAITRTYGNV